MSGKIHRIPDRRPGDHVSVNRERSVRLPWQVASSTPASRSAGALGLAAPRLTCSRRHAPMHWCRRPARFPGWSRAAGPGRCSAPARLSSWRCSAASLSAGPTPPMAAASSSGSPRAARRPSTGGWRPTWRTRSGSFVPSRQPNGAHSTIFSESSWSISSHHSMPPTVTAQILDLARRRPARRRNEEGHAEADRTAKRRAAAAIRGRSPGRPADEAVACHTCLASRHPSHVEGMHEPGWFTRARYWALRCLPGRDSHPLAQSNLQDAT